MHRNNHSTISTETNNQRSAPKQPFNDQHRNKQSAISTETTIQRSAPKQTISDQHRNNHSTISTETNNQRSAPNQPIQHFPRHFLTFDLMECSRMFHQNSCVSGQVRTCSNHIWYALGITLSFSLFFSSLVIVRSSSYEPDVKRFFCRSERSLPVGLSRFLSQFLTNISGTGESK